MKLLVIYLLFLRQVLFENKYCIYFFKLNKHDHVNKKTVISILVTLKYIKTTQRLFFLIFWREPSLTHAHNTSPTESNVTKVKPSTLPDDRVHNRIVLRRKSSSPERNRKENNTVRSDNDAGWTTVLHAYRKQDLNHFNSCCRYATVEMCVGMYI